MSPRSSRARGPALVILLIVGGGAALIALREPVSPTAPPHEAGLAAHDPSKGAPASAAEGFVGVVLARASVEIAPRFEGRLREIRVRLGDSVKEGDVLAVIDAPTLASEIQVASAVAAGAVADRERGVAELSSLEERLARRQKLFAAGLVSQEDLSAAEYDVRFARARLLGATAKVSERRAEESALLSRRRDMELRAPFSGKVVARYVDTGAMVSTLTPVLRLISDGAHFVRFAVPEDRRARLSLGARVRVLAGGGELLGSIEQIAPEIDPASRMITVEAGLSPPPPGGPAPLAGDMARVLVEGP